MNHELDKKQESRSHSLPVARNVITEKSKMLKAISVSPKMTPSVTDSNHKRKKGSRPISQNEENESSQHSMTMLLTVKIHSVKSIRKLVSFLLVVPTSNQSSIQDPLQLWKITYSLLPSHP